MNKIYKSIWNYVTKSWTAVSEIKTVRSKKSSKKKLALLVAGMLPLTGALAAYDGYDGKYDDNWYNSLGNTGDIYLYNKSGDQNDYTGTLVIGGSEAARYYGNLTGKLGDIFRRPSYTLHITDKNDNGSLVELDASAVDLFAHSTNGFSQQIIKAESWNKGYGLKAEEIKVVNDDNENSNQFRQNLTQNGINKATATYLIGGDVVGKVGEYPGGGGV